MGAGTLQPWQLFLGALVLVTGLIAHSVLITWVLRGAIAKMEGATGRLEIEVNGLRLSLDKFSGVLERTRDTQGEHDRRIALLELGLKLDRQASRHSPGPPAGG